MCYSRDSVIRGSSYVELPKCRLKCSHRYSYGDSPQGKFPLDDQFPLDDLGIRLILVDK